MKGYRADGPWGAAGRLAAAQACEREAHALAGGLRGATGVAGAVRAMGLAAVLRSAAGELRAAAAEQAGPGVVPQVHLVMGEAIEDDGQPGRAWLCGGWGDEESAVAHARELFRRAAAAGAALGKPDLVGLSHEERRLVAEALSTMDPDAVVARHGAAWRVVSLPLGGSIAGRHVGKAGGADSAVRRESRA